MAAGHRMKSVLIDLSGTIHVGDEVIPGAVEALRRLRATGVGVKFVTNTTKESREYLHGRLNKIGFDIKREEIFTSLWAAREYLETKKLNPFYLVADDAMEDFRGVGDPNSAPDSVVVGLAPEKFDFLNMNRAFRILLDGGELVAIHESRYYKVEDGLSLGPGYVVKGLEYASGVKAHVVGKPNKEFFKAGLAGVNPEEAIMIGDDAKNDIGGAQNAGIKGFLVKTGKYREGDETKISPPPFKTVDSFKDAVDIVISELICEDKYNC